MLYTPPHPNSGGPANINTTLKNSIHNEVAQKRMIKNKKPLVGISPITMDPWLRASLVLNTGLFPLIYSYIWVELLSPKEGWSLACTIDSIWPTSTMVLVWA